MQWGGESACVSGGQRGRLPSVVFLAVGCVGSEWDGVCAVGVCRLGFFAVVQRFFPVACKIVRLPSQFESGCGCGLRGLCDCVWVVALVCPWAVVLD